MKKPLEDFRALCRYLFDVEPYPYQETILKAIFRGDKKITIRSTTRAGKSYIIAIAAILWAIFKDDTRVGIIAPSYDKTKPIMDYIAIRLSSNPSFDDIVMVSADGMTKLERLRKEVSRKRITFKNGSSIEIKSVDINKRGMGVMGFGYDFVIIDETAEIPDEAFSKVYRMLVENPDTVLLEIGNPWHLNHFYDHHHDDGWTKIHVRWEECVKAGRMTEKAIQDQRREHTDLEFKVLFDAEFPEELEYAIFSNEAIKSAVRYRETPEIEKCLIGVDVARGGRDKTVITVIGKAGREFYYLKHSEHDVRDTMRIVGLVAEEVARYGMDKTYITVDAVGLGAGGLDRLSELQYHASGFVAGAKARNETRFYNRKTEAVFGIADMMKEGRIYNLPSHSRYALELRSWIYEVRSDRQLKVVDPEKSPDHADSLMLALANEIYDETALIVGLENIQRSSFTGKPIMRGLRKRRR